MPFETEDTISPSTGQLWIWKTCPDCGARFYGTSSDIPEHQCDEDDED